MQQAYVEYVSVASAKNLGYPVPNTRPNLSLAGQFDSSISEQEKPTVRTATSPSPPAKQQV